MANIVVKVPDGLYCNGCRFLEQGTVWCKLFDDLVTENDDYSKKIKLDECPKS